MHEVLVNRLFKFAQEKMLLGELRDLFSRLLLNFKLVTFFSQNMEYIHFCKKISYPIEISIG